MSGNGDEMGGEGSATIDRRVRRTRELLRRALISLVLEKGYERVTVQDILDRADVGRSTFYAHYRDKEDLLLSGFEELRSMLAAERDSAERAEDGDARFLQLMLMVFQHVEEHRRLGRAMAGNKGAEVAIRALRGVVADLVRENFRTHFPGAAEDPLRLEAAIRFVVSALIGLFTWWLDEDVPYSAEEIHAIFRRLTTGGVGRFLGTSPRDGASRTGVRLGRDRRET